MSFLTSAVAAVIVDPAGHVLLCQQSQGHRLWGLPGGRIRTGESPVHAVCRDIREETGAEVDIVDLVGIYTLTGDPNGAPADHPGARQARADHPGARQARAEQKDAPQDLPDVLVHVFRAVVTGGDVAVNAPGRIRRLAWHDADALPQPVTATTRHAVADALAGRSGVLRDVQRSPEPASPDAREPDSARASEQPIAVG